MPKTVLITGASSGIGKATALYFADKGWNVAATRRKPGQDQDLAVYSHVHQYPLDVTDSQSIESAIRAVEHDFGTIDVLVNNAGYGTVGPFEASTPKQIEQQFAVNVFGLMDVTRQIIPLMRKQGHGHIINVSSMGGRLAFPLYSAYHATKWAVEGFSESLMYELRPFDIRIKLVEPGLIKTQFVGSSEIRFSTEGVGVYDAYADRIIGDYHQTYKHAAPPETVAATIYRVAQSQSSKLRYPVGRPAPALLALRRLVPDRLFFALTRLGAR